MNKFWIAAGGVLAGMLLLSFGFGFMSTGTANKQAAGARVEGVLSVTTPLCVASALPDMPAVAAMLALPTAKQREALAASGWVTYPADANPALKRSIDEDCIKALKAA